MTERQQEILAAIVEQYAKDAQPVGSKTLATDFDISSATIRAEMAKLEDKGYISQPHTSAGRVPTDKGYRFYVDTIVPEKNLNERARLNRAVKRRLVSAGEPRQAVRSAIMSLIESTQNAAFASLGSDYYLRGLTELFSHPDFSGEDLFSVAQLVDNIDPWLKEVHPKKRLNVYIGHENPIGKSSGCSLIMYRFASPYSDQSYIGVIGPTRQHYGRVMRIVTRTGKTLEEVLNE